VTTPDSPAAPAFDSVSFPKHYNVHASGLEAREITGLLNFFAGNLVKYLFRHGIKQEERPEEWRDVVTDDRYQVSSHGRIRSKQRGFRKLVPVGKGYMSFMVSTPTGARLHYVHHVVAEAFLGPRPDGAQVAHGDGDKQNNRVSNLRYATPKENAADRRRHGTLNSGGKNGQAKLLPDQVDSVRALLATTSDNDIARQFGVSRSTIARIRHGQSWRADLKGSTTEDVKKALWYALAAIEQVDTWPPQTPGPCVVLPMMYDLAFLRMQQVHATDATLLGQVAKAFVHQQPWDARRWLTLSRDLLVSHLGPEVAATVSTRR